MYIYTLVFFVIVCALFSLSRYRTTHSVVFFYILCKISFFYVCMHLFVCLLFYLLLDLVFIYCTADYYCVIIIFLLIVVELSSVMVYSAFMTHSCFLFPWLCLEMSFRIGSSEIGNFDENNAVNSFHLLVHIIQLYYIFTL